MTTVLSGLHVGWSQHYVSTNDPKEKPIVEGKKCCIGCSMVVDSEDDVNFNMWFCLVTRFRMYTCRVNY